MYNKVILVGNLTWDVELKYAPSGIAIAEFGLATNRKYKDNTTNEIKEETMFINITVFGRSAEVANQYLRKGRRVLIEGRLVLNQWVDSSGQKRSKHSIVAESVKFLDRIEENTNQVSQSQSQVSVSQQSKELDDEDIPF